MSARSSNPPPPHAAWLVQTEVRDAIEGVGRQRGVFGPDLEDLRQEVLVRALRVRKPPVSIEQCKVLVRKIARQRLIDDYRTNARRDEVHAGLCDDADDHAPQGSGIADERDPIDVRRQLDVVVRDIETGTLTSRQATILDHALDGLPHEEIARELQLAQQTVKNDLSTARKTMRASWSAYTAAAMFAALVVVVYLALRGNDEVASPPPDFDDLPQVQQERVLTLRAAAEQDCAASRWQACLLELDKAAAIDPMGERGTRFGEMRVDAKRGIAAEPR